MIFSKLSTTVSAALTKPSITDVLYSSIFSNNEIALLINLEVFSRDLDSNSIKLASTN